MDITIDTIDQLYEFMLTYDLVWMFEDEVADINNITHDEFLYLKLKEII